MKKIKEFLAKSQVKATLMMCCLMAMMIPGAWAADGTTTSTATITSAFTTGFQQIASDAVAMIAVIVPIAIGVAGTIFLVRKAMGWFKSIAK
jgi:hypothetical protein